MRIELDQSEIVAILTEWGKTKYGTHNVSVEELSATKAKISVTLSDNDFGTGSTKITIEKFGELAKQMKHSADIGAMENEPLMNYDSVALGTI